jgi:signal transduction histidine kinase
VPGRFWIRLFAAALLVGGSGVTPSAESQDPEPRTVLTIHWGPEEFPPTPIVNATLREALRSDSRIPIDYFSEYLEDYTLPAAQAQRALVDAIRTKYRGRRIDLVVAVADPALEFVLANRDELFAGAPIVYSAIREPATVTRDRHRGVTGVVRGAAYRETLKLGLELHPSVEQVFAIAQSANKDTDAALKLALRDAAPGVPLTFLDADSVQELESRVRSVPRNSLVLYVSYSQGGAARSTNIELLPLVVNASPVPVYGTNEDYIGLGAIGGMVRHRVATAERMAEIALEILRGRSADDIPVESAQLVPTFDARQLTRYGIHESRVPAGSAIRFQTMSGWEAVRPYITVIATVVTVQFVLIGGLLWQRAQRRRAERLIRTREATLRVSFERIRRLTGQLIDAQESTRASIARDLHDDVCQELVAIAIGVGSIKVASPGSHDVITQDTLTRIKDQTLDVVDRVRRLSQDLHPATLRVLGLAAALRAHCIDVENRFDVQVSLDVNIDTGALSQDVSLVLFRIVQEALRNGAVHGEARRLNVSLSRSDDDVELIVADDGKGFDVEAAGRSSGLGLISIEERVHLARGRLSITSRPWHGTTIRVRVPAPPLPHVQGAGRADVLRTHRTGKVS